MPAAGGRDRRVLNQFKSGHGLADSVRMTSALAPLTAPTAPGRRRARRVSALPAPPKGPELLLNASVALPRLVAAVRDAQHVIDISMYGWMDSGSGAELARAVIDRARAGVEVNIMLDGRGSMVGPGLPGAKLVAKLRAAGVHVIVNDSLLPVIGKPVDHCKVYSIDGERGFLGGMNLSKTYDTWGDAMTTLDRAGAIAAGRDFLARWVERGGHVSDANERLVLHPVDEPAPTQGQQILANHPGTSAPIRDAYLGAFATAQHRIWVQSPFLGDRAMVDALMGAARRGVDVRLFTNGPSTGKAVPGINLLGAGFYDELTNAGVKVYQQAQMTHSKVLLADDAAIVGSFNLTTRSSGKHHEISMRSTAPSLVTAVTGMFDAALGTAHLVTAGDLRAPGQRLLTLVQQLLHLQY